MNINTIIFDLGGVIVDLDENATPRALAKLANLPENEVIDLFYSSAFFKDYEMGKINCQEFRYELNMMLGGSFSDQALDQAWNAMLGNIPMKRLEFMNSLRKDYKVMVLSNTNEIHRKAFNQTIKSVSGENSLDTFADHVYLSHEIGMRKPNHDIYQHVLIDSNTNAEESIFLDDKLENLAAAKATGINTMHIKKPDDIFGLKKKLKTNNEQRTKWIQLGLFVLTFLTTTLSGAEWVTGKSLLYGGETISWREFWKGLPFSLAFLGILTVHEFGHYFMAQYHKVKVTLPYYIPLWVGFLGGPSFGTMGAFIKIKDPINSRKKYFDIGIAGPLAGFIIALVVITYGFISLPPIDYLYNIHPEYEQWGSNYAEHVYNEDSMMVFVLGPNLIFWFFENFVVSDPTLIPHTYEVIHYPFLLAGYLALFFTALNLLPIGQLDGGHIMYGLIGSRKHKRFSQVFFIMFLYYAGLGMFNTSNLSELMFDEALYVGFLYLCLYKFTDIKRDRVMIALGIFAAQISTTIAFPEAVGYSGWLAFSFLLGRILGIYHPPARQDKSLDNKRKILGWVSLIVFILCFSPKPFEIKEIQIKEDKSETPTVRSETKPSPYLTRMDIPYSLARASNKSINSGVEINVFDASPLGSKN